MQAGVGEVDINNFWVVFLQLLGMFHQLPAAQEIMEMIQDRYEQLAASQAVDLPYDILPYQVEWRGDENGAFIGQQENEATGSRGQCR